MSLRTIIVGYDGRDTSEDALALGTQLARLDRARLIVAFAYGMAESQGGETAAAADSMLVRALATVPYGVAATTRAIPDGPAAQALEQLAELEKADLIVIGSTDWGPLSRALVGNLAERLLHGSPCPVAVAPKGFRDRSPRPLKLIGVGWDGSEEGEAALERATELAQETQAELRLYTMIEPRSAAVPADFGADMPDPKLLREAAERSLAAACERVPDQIRASGLVLDGNGGGALARQANREGLDLLLVGSRGHGAVGRLLLGSVSDALMRAASCPVLVVPRSALAEERSAGAA
jgi:nucleotide-binding universal stress UspA family protein